MMAPFQLLVIAALVVIALLLAIVVGCASLLTTRLRHTNATLRRIEEALVSQASAVASASVQATPAIASPGITATEGEPKRYLTIRDLKKKRPHKSSHGASKPIKRSDLITSESRVETNPATEVSSAPAHVAIPEASEPIGELENLTAVQEMSAEPLAPESQTRTTDEEAAAPAVLTRNELVAARLVLHTPANASSPEATSPRPAPTDEDSGDRKERDALLIMLNNQRRRRRARHSD